LSEDEQELGVCLVDIGGGTTDVAVFTGGAIRHTSVIPIGGDQVTQDLAIALHVPLQHAEQIKLKFGHAFQDLADNDLGIDLHDLSEFTRMHLPQPLTQNTLAGYIEPRYEDILQAVDNQLIASGIKPYLGAGVVLTGGGSSARGVTNLGEKIFGLPTRVGTPQGVFGLGQTLQNPVYATSVGLLRYGHQQHLSKPFLQDHLGMQQAWTKIKNWFHGYL
jgi:cell division protein FtsA